jgi:hypothetical protein
MSRSAESNSEPLFAGRTALILTALFLMAIAAVVAFSAWDATRRTDIEEFSQVTGVGDVNTFKIPTPVPAVPAPVLTWQGKQYTPVTYKKAKIDDTEMRRVHRDEVTGLALYHPVDKDPAAGLFIKVEEGRYLPLKAN